MKRNDLIKICEDAVVHHTKWRDRDSYVAQKSIQSIYKGLTAGLKYKIIRKNDSPDYHSDDKTLIIEFIKTIDFDKLKNGKHLEISKREDYFRDCDPNYENEMFDGDGIDFYSSYMQSYMPTQNRLDECCIGCDWY